MSTWALVPLKNLAQAKARLAPRANAALRRALVLAMADDVLAALTGVDCIERVVLVSNEPEAGRLLHEQRLDVFYTSDHEGLNSELEEATAYAAAQGADRVLIIHADLPWLTAESLDAFVSQCPEETVCVARDKIGTGTNAVLSPLPLPVPLVFGQESLPAFQANGRKLGVDIQVTDDPALAEDIDHPDDFTKLVSEQEAGRSPGPATAQLLQDLENYRAERAG
ncbi:2-phospho-L-lactate guanylyltransferase [Elongatibacter sediminis]|uniref:3-phospho-D-glycerate guanylyltransferase n=1 Tax=Elongatibacter sediminis TaxID=3119006 RepID=A0AAW9RQH1_9GAMM